MASFYSNLSSTERDMLPTAYLLNQKLSYQSSELPNNQNHPSVSIPYPNFGSVSGQDHHIEANGNRDEMVFIPPTSGIQELDRQLDMSSHYSERNTVLAESHVYSRESVSEPYPQYYGLSLSLGGSQVPSLVQLPSDLNQYTNSNICSFLGSNIQSAEIQLSENNNIKNHNVQYLSFDLAGKNQASNNFENFTSSKETDFVPAVYQAPEVRGVFGSSKYLKAAQDLLDEVVNVHRASVKNSEKSCQDVKKEGVSAEVNDGNTNASNDLSPPERQDLQNKMTKLLSMLDEVDRRYKQYFHQMQGVVSSFDMVVGRGAARPYTALALRTISRQFRTLRDAIKKQVQSIQKSLGEQDANSDGHSILSRLRHVDQQLRQQKALQQFGIMRQPWRPQRGLPESAVSVLRAWLFEHFLHPYPKDSEKLVLARQTGLTRSQVANWFINARVRLWKPMIEEMYKEEFGNPENEPKSSPENANAAGEISTFDEREEEFQGNLVSAATDRNHSNEGISGTNLEPELSYRPGGFQENFAMGNQVSLALGLQHAERDSTPASSTEIEKMEYYYVEPVNNQHRFANSHLLSDFVA